jgi:4-alpha-glucanotransferase
MKAARLSGVLLHPTSLPGPYGIGELGEEAHRFIESLTRSGVGLWQVLPLGPTAYGDSPYQSLSAFAGNPLLVSLDVLRRDGLLDDGDVEHQPRFSAHEVDFGAVIDYKLPLLQKAYGKFQHTTSHAQQTAFAAFCKKQAAWLDDFALFAVVKEQLGGRSWHEWEEGIRDRHKDALAGWRHDHAEAIRSRQFWQFLFFQQWRAVHDHAKHVGIKVMGDIPIFVAHDSADVWAHPQLFRLDDEGRPLFVAGVPPDYFSATGQLWGNPLYRWDLMAKDGYRWWIDRFRATFAMVDVVRLDHFRGFEAYWEIPAGEETAVRGHWRKGPGASFFKAVRDALGDLPIVAENLGVITPEVEALREKFSLPGMAILQFAWGDDPQGSDFLPHNFPHNRVVYTGTHDNDTTVGWWTSGVGDSTRSLEEVERERRFALSYMNSDGREIHWDFIRTLLASVADVAIVPLQDVLGLGSEARMNLPGRPGGNWRWRVAPGAVKTHAEQRLREMNENYGRCARRA